MSDRLARLRDPDADRYRWVVLTALLFGFFTVASTITILTISLPSIADDFDSSVGTVQWTISGPILAFAIFGPIYGKLGDLRGHRGLYLFGMAGATTAAILSALAWNAPSLIAFRILGAVTGAAAGPSSMAIINGLFPPEERVKAMGYWSMVVAGGPVVGVVAGGVVIDAIGWRAIFVGQAPLAAGTVLIAFLILPRTQGVKSVRFDIAGSVTLGTGVLSLLLGLSQARTSGIGSPWVWVLLGVGLVVLRMFLLIEKRADAPLLPLDYLRERNFSAPIVANFFIQFAYMGGFLLAPLLFVDVLGYHPRDDAGQIGSILLWRPLSFAVMGIAGGYLAVKIGERSSAMIGTASVAASMGVLAMVHADSGLALVFVGLVLSGVGLGIANPSMSSTVANAVQDSDLGVAGAAQQMISQIGTVSGMSVMTTVQQLRLDDAGVVGSYRDAYLVGGLFGVAGIVSAAFMRSTARRGEAVSDQTKTEPANA